MPNAKKETLRPNFFKNAGLIAAAEIVLKLKGLIFIPLLSRHFGALNYGVWAQVNVLTAAIYPIIVLGTDSAVSRHLPGRPLHEQKRLFSAWFVFMLAVSATVCSLIYMLSHQVSIIFFGAGGQYEHFIPLVAATIFITLLLNIVRSWFLVQNNAMFYSLVSVSQAILGVGALFLVMVRGESVYELVVYSLFADLITILWLLLAVTILYGWNSPDFSILPTLLKYGLPLVPAGYAMWGLNVMDRLFLVKYATLSDIGVYSLVYSLGYTIIPLFARPFRAMYPNAVSGLYNRGDLKGLQKLYEHSAGMAFLLTIPVSVLMFILGKNLIAVVATHEFMRGVPLIALISYGYIFSIMASFFEVELGLAHRQYWFTISITTGCAVNLVLNILLIPRYSIMGAAIATFAGFLTQLVVSFIASRKYKILSSSPAFIIKIISSASIMGIIVYFLNDQFMYGYADMFRLISMGGAGALIYVFCLHLFKIFNWRLHSLRRM